MFKFESQNKGKTKTAALLPTAICQLLLLILSTLIPTYAQSDIREYDIEIIIFEDTTDKYIDSEKWSALTKIHDKDINSNEPDQSINAEHDITTNINTVVVDDTEYYDESLIDQQIANDSMDDELVTFSELPAEYPDENSVINITEIQSSLLNEEVEKLSKSSRYKILTHKAWRQTGLDKKTVISVPVDSTIYNIKKPDEINPEISLDFYDDYQHFNNQSVVKGDIKIELARYLHVYTDLIYQKQVSQVSPLDNEANISKSFTVKAHRRMRSKEIHYIDHPLIGILVMAMPVTASSANKAE